LLTSFAYNLMHVYSTTTNYSLLLLLRGHWVARWDFVPRHDDVPSNDQVGCDDGTNCSAPLQWQSQNMARRGVTTNGTGTARPRMCKQSSAQTSSWAGEGSHPTVFLVFSSASNNPGSTRHTDNGMEHGSAEQREAKHSCNYSHYIRGQW
jgi:hypothetical protein